MGTMIQRHFIGDNETLNLDNPDLIRSIHEEFIAAGADIIETNSFGANRISQQEYGRAGQAAEMAYCAARIARQAADEASRPVYVAGSVGLQEKKALSSRGRGRLRGFLELRRPWVPGSSPG